MSGKSLLPIVAGALAVITGVAVIPRTEERTVMLMRDGDPRAGLALLSGNSSHADDPKLAMQEIRLNEAAGRVDAALEGLSRYIEKWPQDESALLKMAGVAKSAMQPEQRIVALRRLVVMKPRSLYVGELLGLYRQRGDAAGERALIAGDLDNPAWTSEDLQRVGSMFVAQGDEESAATAYRYADQRADAKEHEGRFKLLRLLVAKKKWPEASQRAARWISRWDSTYLAVEAALAVAAAGGDVLPIVKALPAGDTRDLDLVIAAGLAGKGYRRMAISILDEVPARTPAGHVRRIGKFVEAARAAQDPRPPLTYLASLLETPGRGKDAAWLANAIADEFGIETLLPLIGDLRAEVLAERPLFGVELALAGQNQMLARQILLKTRGASVAPNQSYEFAEMMFAILGPDFQLSICRK